MKFVLTQDKVTKNKKVRYADSDNHNIYFTPEEADTLGNPEKVEVEVKAVS